MSAERELLRKLIDTEAWVALPSRRSAVLGEFASQSRALLAQPERKPLTRDQLRNIWPKDDMSFGAFQLAADAIERAHGIE